MKIKIPTDWSQISVEQWMHATRVQSDRFEVVAAVTGLTVEELRQASELAMTNAHAAVMNLLNKKPSRLYREFKLDGETLTFIPDWADFTAGEYADAEYFASNIDTMAHEFLSVMYRKADKSNPWKTRLVPYGGPIGADRFKKVPADVLGGCFLFFYLIDEHYRNGTLQYLAAAALAKSRLSTGGITPSISLRARMQHAWRRWKNGLWKGH
jgi:hypothetical protein